MRYKQGNSLLEVVVSMAILAIVLVMFVGSVVNLAYVEIRARNRALAAQFAREGLEIAYNLSLQNWDSFMELDQPYSSGNGFSLVLKTSPTPFDQLNPSDPFPYYQIKHVDFESDKEIIDDQFTRVIYFSSARRDADGNVVEEQVGTDDPLTRRVTAQVSWQEGDRQEEVVLTTYITNLSGIVE